MSIWIISKAAMNIHIEVSILILRAFGAHSIYAPQNFRVEVELDA